MRILMTGGTGLIGQAFTQQFSKYHYTVLTRSPAKAKALLPSTVTVINSLNSLQNLNDFDAVINLAGEAIIDKRWSIKQKEIICQSRWQITEKLAELFKCSQQPPKVFLSGSAIGIYQDQGANIITENSPVQEVNFPTMLCLGWESIAKQAWPYSRVVLLRTGIVLSPYGGALAKMLPPFKYWLGGRIGDGQQYMPWIHYVDYINAIDELIHNDTISGPINLVAPNAVKNTVFTKTLANTLQRKAIIPVPKQLLRLLLGESSCLLLDSLNVSPEVLLNNQFNFSYPSLKQALTDLIKKPANDTYQ